MKSIKRIVGIFVFLFFIWGTMACCSYSQENERKQPALKLWYDKPATEWMTSALPIGNGELGAMIFGGVKREQIQFNEKTLWSGSPALRGAYQNFGNLFIEFSGHTDLHSKYRRELSLDDAKGSVSYQIGDVQYLREYFVSRPDGVIVMRFTTPGSKGKLSFAVKLEGTHEELTEVDGNRMTFSGKLDWLTYKAQAVVLNEGGLLVSDSGGVEVSGADAVTILLTGGTNYDVAAADYIGESAEQLYQRIRKRLGNVVGKPYEALLGDHLADYQPLFNRVKFDLKADMPDMPTDVLVRSHREHRYLDVLYFQYGRYLMLGSSRGMGLPNNLQGIWNDNNNPPWQCDIHTNINIQMNYWPAETTNLSECHLPFINYIHTEATKEKGAWQEVAGSEGNRGWAIKTQSNIFGYTDWNINRPANAWYVTHLWQHFAYTRDVTYLREIAFPVMKSACEYWFDRLTETENGTLIAPDEWSPEQGPWIDGVAYAQQLVWELFDQTVKAGKILKADAVFMEELTTKSKRLDCGVEVGSWGQIKEWKEDTAKLDTLGNVHRHLSQLIALYPGNQISYLIDGTYADAAKQTLNSRGEEGTGWSRAWKIACWARLFDGDRAYRLLKSALNLTDITVISMENNDGGVYENLLDAHPPFQIDGNLGATAGMAELLLQSNQRCIHLLPALPSAWPNGAVSGLKAEGGYEVDICWKSGELEKATIRSAFGGSFLLRYEGRAKEYWLEPSESLEVRLSDF